MPKAFAERLPLGAFPAGGLALGRAADDGSGRAGAAARGTSARRNRKTVVDAAAAALLLQSWLDAQPQWET